MKDKWQPIETAPEDTLLLVWQEWGPRLRYIRHGELWDENEFLDDSEREVSHWMPLPEPPEDSNG